MLSAVIVQGVRTPFTKFNTLLKNESAEHLCKYAIREVIERAELDANEVDHVIIGNGAQSPEAPNIARNAALKAGLPQHIPAYTVQRNCASGMQSVSDAAMMIQSDLADVVIAGGVESNGGNRRKPGPAISHFQRDPGPLCPPQPSTHYCCMGGRKNAGRGDGYLSARGR